MTQQVQARAADTLATIAIGAWTLTLADLNVILETVTLTLGMVAGVFALFFHIRRYRRGKTMNVALKETQQKLDAALAKQSDK